MRGVVMGLVLCLVVLVAGLAFPAQERPAPPADGVAAAPRQVTLEQTYYHDGDVRAQSIAVAADGTVAVAVNSGVGPGNSPKVRRPMILLFDKTGNPVGRIIGRNTIMGEVCFGPDGRVYSAEQWFGAGTHVYDREGAQRREVPKRKLRADGSHVNRGGPWGVAVGPDLRVYTINSRRELCVTSPEDNLLRKLPGSGYDKVRVAADGTVYSGNKVLQKDDAWKEWDYWVRDIRAYGRMLVSQRHDWGIYDPVKGRLERPVRLPPLPPGAGDWAASALGPDDNVYLVPRDDPGLAYVVADPQGHVLLRRGADFDRLRATLPQGQLEAGSSLTVEAEMTRSRDLGYVPQSQQLPHDNRPTLAITAALAPSARDPLAPLAWQSVPVTAEGKGKYQLSFPRGLVGQFTLRLAATPAGIPGMQPLAVESKVTLLPAGAKAFLVPGTDRNRTGFVAGQSVRLAVPVTAQAGLDLRQAKLTLSLGAQAVWQAPLGLGDVPAGPGRTAVVTVPGEVTARLHPGVYAATVTDLPPGVFSGSAVVALVDPVRPTDFITPLLGTGDYGVGPQDTVRNARLCADLGYNHIVGMEKWDGAFLDALTRQGLTFHFQPYGHHHPVNVLPAEYGAVRQQIAALAQRMLPYPSFRGFNYHSLIQHPRFAGSLAGHNDRARHEAMWDDVSRAVAVPETVPADLRDTYAHNVVSAAMLPRLYAALAEAVGRVDERLDRTTMQWWHAPLWVADPDRVAQRQGLVATQHSEEQYYHPVTVANQADLWRRPGKPLWVYGNTDWQDDGTGAAYHTDLMAALSRGVQGAGRTGSMPTAGQSSTQTSERAMTPALGLLHAYGGLSAACEPADQVAVWRSFHEEACAKEPTDPARSHQFHTTAAYTACLYAHRAATILTDDRVRAGELKKYRAVVVSFAFPLPPDLAARLKEFRDGGGLVLANRPADGYWCPPGAVELGPAFGRSHADYLANTDSERHVGIEEDGRKGAAVLLKALGDRVRPLADCDDPTTWLSVLAHGPARYVFAVNLKRLPQDPMDLHRYSGYENTRMPTRTRVRLVPGHFAVYDVFAGKRLTPVKRDGAWEVEADLSVFPGAIFALLPAPLDRVRLSAGQAADRSLLRVRAEVTDAGGKTIDAAVPLEVTIQDAAAGSRYHLSRTAVHGMWEETLPVAANDASGRWKVVITERLSGRQVAGEVDVKLPALPEARPTPAVEWTNAERVGEGLRRAKRVGLVVGGKQAQPLAGAVRAVEDWLAGKGKVVERVGAKEYLADREKYQLSKFQFGQFPFGSLKTDEIKVRPARYDLIVTFDTPALPGGVVPRDLLPIAWTASDPGPARGLVQYAVMPVYDTEDAVSLAGGDAEGLLEAAKSLALPPDVAPADRPAAVTLTPLESTAKTVAPAGLRQFLGVPVGELAATPDGQRIAVGMKGWGNNLFVLDGDGRVVGRDVCGKFFPVQLGARGDGFTAVAHENDPTTLYLKLYDRDGRPRLRLAAPGRRVGGVRDWTPSHPSSGVLPQFLKQASFSVTSDGRLAAAGGSKAIAVWDLQAGKLLWRDDAVHYSAPAPQSRLGPRDLAPGFPQLKLAADGKGLALQHNGAVSSYAGATGDRLGRRALPPGVSLGPVQVYDGHVLVVGGPHFERPPFSEFFAWKDERLLWHWTSPRPVTATAFAADGLHYAIGEVDGTLRLMEGGGQVAGWLSPDGAIASLSLSPGGDRVAFATTGGWAGVMDFGGRVLWQKDLGARAVIGFLGDKGDTVAGDWRGFVHRFGPTGEKRWEVNLTVHVWRDDLAALLTRPDPTPALRLPAPDRARVTVPQGARNLAPSATVRLLRPTHWFGEDRESVREVRLNDGRRVPPAGGWFSPLTLELAAFVPSPPAWELEWKEPVTVNTLVAYESADHPEAVPEEIRIEAWTGDGWKVVAHELWNRDVVHVQRFESVTTTKLRYTPLGDLAKNVWLSEIEVFNVPH